MYGFIFYSYLFLHKTLILRKVIFRFFDILYIDNVRNFGIFDDVIINAIFVIALHAGDDALNRFNAHARFDVGAKVVQQQDTLLVVTDLS